jgi:rod shape-determining protein MreC
MKRRGNILVVGLFLTAVLLVFLVSPRNRQRLQSGFLTVISPFLKKGSEWDSSFREYRGRVKKLKELEEENTELRTKLDDLRSQNAALRGFEKLYHESQKAVGFKEQAPFALVPARVIGRPISNWWHTADVDKGSAEGVEIGMAVLTPDGLVGKTVLVADHSATVLLITDENCKVAATVTGSRDPGKQGIVHVEVRGERSASNLQPRMILNFVSKNAQLEPDQEIETSGAGQVYPPGIKIGRVLEFKPRELHGEALLEPAANLATLSDVFIVAGVKTNGKVAK